MVTDKNSVELISLLMKAVNEKGVEKTKAILKKGLEEGYDNQDRILAFIIKSVWQSYTISETELFVGRSRKFGKRTKARSMLVYMLREHMGYSQTQISKVLNLNKATTCRDIKYMDNLTERVPEEKTQIIKKNKINEDILVFVENNKE